MQFDVNIQDSWDDEPLHVTFFLRSQEVSPLPELTMGSLTAVFSNFEVLKGNAIRVPEPATATGALMLLALGFCGRTRR